MTYGNLGLSMIADAYESVVDASVEISSETGQRDQRSFRSLVLENEFLLVTVVPELGGRIVGMLDKRSGVELLGLEQLREPRGVSDPQGVSVSLTGGPRPNGSGLVDSLLLPSDSDGVAAIWIGENSQGPLGFHLKIQLRPDRAEIELECRVINRTLYPVHYNGGLLVGGAFQFLSGEGGVLCWDQTLRAGVAITSDELRFATFDGNLIGTRFDRQRSMAPRQVDTWTAVFHPLGGIDAPGAFTGGVAASFDPDMIRLATSAPRPNHKLLVLTENGETLEAITDLEPATTRSFPLDPAMGARSIALLDATRSELFRTRLGETLRALEAFEERAADPLERYLDPNSELGEEGFEWANRALFETVSGLRALTNRDYEAADRRFEQSLLYNAEDHLTWWYKAVARRLGGDTAGEFPELLNAHYLAPLEPALRAEAFLSQPISTTADTSPLLESFGAIASNFLEVACLLVEAGLFADASRWIDEAIRHRDMPMLRFLNAYCLLKGTRLDAEAASQVVAGVRLLPTTDTHPFRHVERVAIETLCDRFPEIEELRSIV